MSQKIVGVVYEWVLDKIEPNVPLHGTSYVGQVVRAGLSAEKMLKERTQEHIRSARGRTRDLGLHAAIEMFGVAAFSINLLATRFDETIAVKSWANEREIDEIEKRGGVLQDMEPDEPIHQTFNLTLGGQGDAVAVFAGINARRTKLWKMFKLALESYVEEHHTAAVEQRVVLPCGYRLGFQVTKVRTDGRYTIGHPNESKRREWLESLPGWTWHGRKSAKWVEGASERMKAQREAQGHEARAEQTMLQHRKQEAMVQARRAARRALLSPLERARFDKRQTATDKGNAKKAAELKALKSTFHPKALHKDLQVYKKDGTISDALSVIATMEYLVACVEQRAGFESSA